MNWDDQAACQSVDPELFFPAGQDTPSQDGVNAAVRVCRGCPVRLQCLEFALETRLEYGVWGGLTEQERRSLRRSRQRKARRMTSASVA